jgi:hypothetical protein
VEARTYCDSGTGSGRSPGPCEALVSVLVSVHQAVPDRTLAIWLDSTPDLSCTDSTQADWVDVEHQATDLAVGGSNPSRRAPKPQVNGPARRRDGTCRACPS